MGGRAVSVCLHVDFFFFFAHVCPCVSALNCACVRTRVFKRVAALVVP
jgi:hypothetical protein